MPFLRVIRDKRGYETTYLMHWYREGNRQHSRVLYVFRSPGGVRVGRNPLDPEILQEIEAQHPDISFDWKVVRENQQVIESTHEPRRRRPRAEEEAAAAAPAVRPPEVLPVPPRPAIPSAIEGDTPDAQMAFLTQVYAIVRERIHLRTSLDPSRQEALLALAERLNAAAWTDADQITSGLQQAAEALERLAHVFARRRRRARKKPRSGEGAPTGSEPIGDEVFTATGDPAVANEGSSDPGAEAAIDSEESSSL